MKIITNTASVLKPEEGRKLGITVIPAFVSIRGRSLRDYIDVGSDEYIDLLEKEDHPSTSQPSAGDVLDLMENADEDTIVLTVGDGLSGEYSTAVGLRNTLPNRSKIHIINSETLGAPLHYLALKAVKLRDQGLSVKEIVSQLRASASSSTSFVIPSDFRYLLRSGRISQITSKIGGSLKLLPVLTQTEDRKRIALVAVKRTWQAAVGTVASKLQKIGVNDDFLLSVGYADRPDLAERVSKHFRELFPSTENEVFQLAPSLITHGGPGCIVVQAVRK